jgi:hypothetical protein
VRYRRRVLGGSEPVSCTCISLVPFHNARVASQPFRREGMSRLSSEGGEREGAHLFDFLFSFSATLRRHCRHLFPRARQRQDCRKAVLYNSEHAATARSSWLTGQPRGSQACKAAICFQRNSPHDLPDSSTASATLPTRRSRYLLPHHGRTAHRAGSFKCLLLLIFCLLGVQPSSPSTLGLDLVHVLRRRLLQATKSFSTLTPDNTHLKLCESTVCDSKRPNGPGSEGDVCDRWARGDACPSEQIFRVNGDPGTNDKAEMFFNLRSPWNVTCEKVKSSPLPCPSVAAVCLEICHHVCTCDAMLLHGERLLTYLAFGTR